MFKSIFTRYICLFIAIILCGFAFLCGFMAVKINDYSVSVKHANIERSASGTVQSINSYMKLCGGGMDYLLLHEKDILMNTLQAEADSAEAVIFITNAAGSILISSEAEEGDFLLESVPDAGMDEAIAAAQGNSYLTGDLHGFFAKKKLTRVILMEKEFTYDSQNVTKSQIVGAIFIASGARGLDGFVSDMLKSFLVAAMLVIAATLFGFLAINHNIIRPVREMSEAARSYAKGDLSARVPVRGKGEIATLAMAFNTMAVAMANNELGRASFVTNISHDLRTPMTTIAGFVQNMLEGVIPPEKHEYYLGIILDEVHRLSRLVGTLLETSRMNAGERKYDFKPLEICELGRITLLSFEKRIDEKKIDVSFDSDEDRIMVRGDADALHQVIYNLIDNAIKFTPESGKLSIEIHVQGEKAFFTVENTGDGIPADELPYLFDRFYKSDRSRGLDKAGMGLGLYIAKSVVQAHGEEIWVTSEYGKFCRFVFTLPLTEDKIVTKQANMNTNS